MAENHQDNSSHSLPSKLSRDITWSHSPPSNASCQNRPPTNLGRARIGKSEIDLGRGENKLCQSRASTETLPMVRHWRFSGSSTVSISPKSPKDSDRRPATMKGRMNRGRSFSSSCWLSLSCLARFARVAVLAIPDNGQGLGDMFFPCFLPSHQVTVDKRTPGSSGIMAACLCVARGLPGQCARPSLRQPVSRKRVASAAPGDPCEKWKQG